jgi:hypothetical protein
MKILKNIPKDKIKHLEIGFLLGAFIYVLTMATLSNLDYILSNADLFTSNQFAIFCGISILIVAIIGLAKEILWDKLLNMGTFEWLDILFTIIGGFVASLLMTIGICLIYLIS